MNMSEVLVGAGLVATWGGSIWIGRFAAIRNHKAMSLLSAFVPLIAVIYGLDNLERCWGPLLIIFIGFVILGLNLF